MFHREDKEKDFVVQAELDKNLEEAPETVEPLPKQVKSTDVIYMPRKDFTARINQTEYQFAKGVRTRVTRDVANMLLEDEDRGYLMEEN